MHLLFFKQARMRPVKMTFLLSVVVRIDLIVFSNFFRFKLTLSPDWPFWFVSRFHFTLKICCFLFVLVVHFALCTFVVGFSDLFSSFPPSLFASLFVFIGCSK
eukprot:TRINITY_DN18512_c0_g1_i3.p2 TRINITY_DN18512_c0_g1~~TRINITY_DN18512_c0_g1_i3.p2  ORF type:complete len:103 (-),score=3.90 TRINITY_DN18512_c0_g1_i3:403-711(-)